MAQPTFNVRRDEPTVIVVDDDTQSRKSVEFLLRTIYVDVQAFASADKFLSDVDATKPACLILDVRMPGMSGLDLQKRLCEARAPISIIMLTAHAEVSMVVRAMKAGAVDFLEKPYSPQTLLDRVHQALEKLSRVQQDRQELAQLRARLDKLSAREAEVMGFLVTGQNTKLIAAQLDISDKTVDFHRRNLLLKMRVDTVVELARLIEFHQRSQVAGDR